MAYIGFRRPDCTASYGRIEGDRVFDYGAAGMPATLRAAISAGSPDDPVADDAILLAEPTLLPVIPDPGQIPCVGHHNESHRQETGRAKVAHPSIFARFARFADTLIADRQPIVLPHVSDHLDGEGKPAIVIGCGGRHIAEADALDHVAGYACSNDAGVRDGRRTIRGQLAVRL